MIGKRFIAGLVFPLFLCLCQAQAQTFTNILAQNINADESIVEIELPMPFDGRMYVLIAWLREDGQQTYHPYIARGGKNLYELRNHPLWQGPIKVVATNIKEAQGTVRPATFLDEIRIFLMPEKLIPATINMLSPNTLFLWRWNYILLGLLFVFALLFFIIGKKGIVLSLVFGFTISWGVMDLRKMYDHWMIVQHMESEKLTVPAVLQALKVFLNGAAEKIGDKSWRTEGLNVLELHMAEYSLASYKYALRAPSKLPVDYIITNHPKQRNIIWQYDRYYLVKENK